MPGGQAVADLYHLWPCPVRRGQYRERLSAARGGCFADAPLPRAPREKLAAMHVLQEAMLDALRTHSDEHLALKPVEGCSKADAAPAPYWVRG